MKLGIVVAGSVGGTLGTAWAQKARLREAHAMLWIDLALQRGLGRDWAFARVKR
jgi:hypothetical protein